MTHDFDIYDRNRKEIQNEDIYDRNRKEIQNELFKDTPFKNEASKPYIDNITIGIGFR